MLKKYEKYIIEKYNIFEDYSDMVGDVYTPPSIALVMVEMAYCGDELYVDACSKSGVFSEIIVSKLFIENPMNISDKKERINYILRNNLIIFGLSTHHNKFLKSMLISNKYYGNIIDKKLLNDIIFDIEDDYKNMEITMNTIKEERENLRKYKIISIGNPPYQKNNGGGNGSSAENIFQTIIEELYKFSDKCITVHPAKFENAVEKRFQPFRDILYKSNKLVDYIYYENSQDMFPGIRVQGGICISNIDKTHNGKCNVTVYDKNGNVSKTTKYMMTGDVYLKSEIESNILEKINAKTSENDRFDSVVHSRRPFGINSDLSVGTKESKRFLDVCEKNDDDAILVYCWNSKERANTKYINRNEIPSNSSLVDTYKVLFPKTFDIEMSYPNTIISKPFVGGIGECCSETYLTIGPFGTKIEAEHCVSYMNTRLVRFCMYLLINTQNLSKKVFRITPIDKFDIHYTDEILYKKYNLTTDEIDYIETIVSEIK